MSKKLLSEAQIRRFAKLASLPALRETTKGRTRRDEPPGARLAYDDLNEQEDEFEEIEGEVDTALPPGEEVEMAPGEEEITDELPGEEVEMEADLGDPEAVATEIFTAIADVLGVEIDVGGDVGGLEGEEEVLDDTEIPDDVGGLEGEEEVLDDTEIVDDEEEMFHEALKGINYIPGKTEVVNEVANRVAKRLLKAKRAEKNLKEALGSKRPQQRSRRPKRK